MVQYIEKIEMEIYREFLKSKKVISIFKILYYIYIYIYYVWLCNINVKTLKL